MNRCVEAVLELVGIIRTGELIAKRGEALKLVGEILMCLGDFLDRQEIPTFGDPPESAPETIAGCCEYIEGHLAVGASQQESVGLNPLLVLVIRRLIKLLIDQLL